MEVFSYFSLETFRISVKKQLECKGWKVKNLKFERTKLEVLNTMYTLSCVQKYYGKDFEAMMMYQPLFRSLVLSSSLIQGKLWKSIVAQRSFISLPQGLIMCKGQNMRHFLNGTMKNLVIHYCFILLLTECKGMRGESCALFYVNNLSLFQLNTMTRNWSYTTIKLKL